MIRARSPRGRAPSISDVRIAFNAQLLSYRQTYRSAGIARYIDRLLNNLPGALAPGDQVATYVGPSVPVDAPAVAWSRVVRSRLPTHRPLARILWEQTLLPVLARTWGADLVHAPAYVLPPGAGLSTVVTFHDLSFFRMPDAFNRANRLFLQSFSRASARRADRVIAVSASTRDDLVDVLGVPPERIDVVYNGVDARFQPEVDPRHMDRFRSERGLPERFILYLGTLEPRKNLGNLLRAYAIARRRGVVEPLVIAGGPGWGDLVLTRAIEELGLGDSVRPIGYVPAEEQPGWYAAATVFAYPSLYEGFGLPALEAMACGTAVVASNRSSLPEVVGDAGLLADPSNPEALAESITTLLRDDDLRRDFGRRGVERARAFSWDNAARRTVDAYRAALVVPRSDGIRKTDWPTRQAME